MKTTKFYVVKGVLEHEAPPTGDATMILVQTSEAGDPVEHCTLITIAHFETNAHGQSEIESSASVIVEAHSLKYLAEIFVDHAQRCEQGYHACPSCGARLGRCSPA